MARPKLRPGLDSTTRRECAWYLAQGFTKEQAAKKAGLPHPARLSSFSRTMEFAAELREALNDHLSINLAPRAVRIMAEIMDDKAVSPKVRLDAAKAIADRAGFTARSSDGERPLDEVELYQMTQVQLLRCIGELDKQVRDTEMRTVDATELGPNKALHEELPA